LFPTTVLCKPFTGFTQEFVCFPCQQHVTSLTRIPNHATLHLVCAASLFVILALMSIFLFRLSDCPKEKQSPQKRKRNVVFLVCGLVILASIAAAGIYLLVAEDEEQSTFVLWMEAIALLAFGISWLTKGEAYLKDKPDSTARKTAKAGSVS
jgi:undecaprenyl pyrophosphate phosphatase UppP